MTGPTTPVALVTGCSSGIGRATARALCQAGLLVYASARRPETLDDLAGDGIEAIRLDVTDEESMDQAVKRINTAHGRLDVLVNNAGYRVVGPVEEVPPDEVVRLFDTNVFGVVRLTRLVLPGMRERRYGRIVNLSSIFGRFAIPGGAYPAATKHAIEAFSDGLRLEVAPFGIRVVLIEPSSVRSSYDTNAVWTGDTAGGPYAKFNQDVARWHAEALAGPPYNLPGRLALPPEAVARVITRAVTSPRPRARYPVGKLSRPLFLLRRTLPGPMFDAFVRRQFPAP
jgi:NAD(P)-dependent dehydrogenase (short-subunit alcohol dehydrogenase family)